MNAPKRHQHLITTTPRRATCWRCRRVTLEGTEMGAPYRVDAIPLNLHGELDARLHGRNTYRVIAGRLALREPHDIAADTRKGRPPVCATHSCAPVNPHHVDPAHAGTFVALTAEPLEENPEPAGEQHAMFVLTGRFAGAQLTAIPVDDPDLPPF